MVVTSVDELHGVNLHFHKEAHSLAYGHAESA